MKSNLILIVVLTTFLSLLGVFVNKLYSQNKLEWRKYNGIDAESKLHKYATKKEFPMSGVAEDFGPRPNGGYQFHSGLDLNTRGSGDDDVHDLLLSLESGVGTIVEEDGPVQNSWAKFITIHGAHYLRYVHIFKKGELAHKTKEDKIAKIEYGGILLKWRKLDKDVIPDSKKDWVIIFRDSGNYSAIGPVADSVQFTTEKGRDTTIAVTNKVNQGDPVCSLGNSKDFVGAGHLHLEILSELKASNGSPITPGEDERAKNPLQVMDQPTPSYKIKILNKSNTPGLELQSDGTKDNTIKARIENWKEGANGTNDYAGKKRYDHYMGVDEVFFEVKSETISNYTPIKGFSFDRISEGGHDNSSFMPKLIIGVGKLEKYKGGWDKTGVDPYAYWTQAYDDFYFADYISRIHKDDMIADGKKKLTDTPKNSRYNDGNYSIRVRMKDIKFIEFFSENEEKYCLDNFQPFIEVFDFMIDDLSKVYTCNRIQYEGIDSTKNDGIGKVEWTYFKTSNLPSTSYPVALLFSEPVRDVKIEGELRRSGNTRAITSKTMIANDTATKVNYYYNFTTTDLHDPTIGDTIKFKITAKDLAGNTLIDVYTSTSSNKKDQSFFIPTRNAGTANETYTATHWNRPPAHRGQDYFEINISDCQQRSLSTTNCEELSSLFHEETYNQCGVGSINVILENSSAYYITWTLDGVAQPQFTDLYELVDVPKGQYCYFIESLEGCCTSEGCIELLKENLIPQELQNASLEIITDCNGTRIDLKLDPNTYNIEWYETNAIGSYKHLPENSNKISITNLAQYAKYKAEVSHTSNLCKRTLEIETEIVYQKLELKNPSIKNTICGESIGSITFINTAAKGGINPYSIEWSNGETSTSLNNLSSGYYTITVTDNQGCTVSETFDVNPSDVITVPPLITKSCLSNSEGTIELMASIIRDENPIFSWSAPFTQEANVSYLQNLPVGQYCVTVTYPNNSCTFEKCYEVLPKDPAPLSFTGTTKATCAGQYYGSITLNVIGGSGNYIYNWKKGGKSGTGKFDSSIGYINNLEDGEYQVTVSDYCGNKDVENIVVGTIGDNITASHKIIASHTEREDVQTIELTVNGSNYSFYWYKLNKATNQFQLYSRDKNITGVLFPGKYYVTIINPLGCVLKYEIFECEDVDPKISFDMKLENLIPCNEGLKIEAKISNIKGEKPLLIYWNNSPNSSVDTSIIVKNYSKFIGAKARVTNRCGISKDVTMTKECNKFCSDDCIKFKVTGPACYDDCGGYPEIQTLVTNCTKLKIESKCNDNIIRNIQWIKHTTYQGNKLTSLEGSDIYYSYGQSGNTSYFYIKNSTTGCETQGSIKFPNKCPVDAFYHWFLNEYGNGCECTKNEQPSVDVTTLCDSKDWNCDKECKLCINEKWEDDNGSEQCDIKVYCDDGTLRSADYTIGFNEECKNLPICPFWVGGVVRVKNTNYTCEDYFLDMEFENSKKINYFFVNNRDSIFGENISSKGIVQTLKMKLLSQDTIKAILLGKDSSFIILGNTISNGFINKVDANGKAIGERIVLSGVIKYILSNEKSKVEFTVSEKGTDVVYLVNNSFELEKLNYFPYKNYDKLIKKDGLTILSRASKVEVYKFDKLNSNFNLPFGIEVSNLKIVQDSLILFGCNFQGEVKINNLSYSSDVNNILFILTNHFGKIIKVEHVLNNESESLIAIDMEGDYATYASKVDVGGTENSRIYCEKLSGVLMCTKVECCKEYSGKLSLDTTQCQLNWLPYTNSSYKAVLQIKTGEGFIDLAEATSPYDVSNYQNGTFRLVAKSVTCPELYSNEVVVNCDTTQYCPANSLDLSWISDSIVVDIDLVKNLNFELRIDYIGYEGYGYNITTVYDSLFIPLSGSSGPNTYKFNYDIIYNIPSYPNAQTSFYTISIKCPNCIDYCVLDTSDIAFKSEEISEPRRVKTKVIVYPNPFTSGFTMDINSLFKRYTSIEVYNSKGQKIFDDFIPLAKGENRYYLKESENWVQGVYYIILNSQDGDILHESKMVKME